MALAYLTQRQQLKHLSKKEYLALKDLCSLAKNMYNVTLYNIRQHFFNTGKYLNYYDNYHLVKSRLGGSKLTILQSRGNLDMPVRIRVS